MRSKSSLDARKIPEVSVLNIKDLRQMTKYLIQGRQEIYVIGNNGRALLTTRHKYEITIIY